MGVMTKKKEKKTDIIPNEQLNINREGISQEIRDEEAYNFE